MVARDNTSAVRDQVSVQDMFANQVLPETPSSRVRAVSKILIANRRQYSAEEVRYIAGLLNPDYIRQGNIESIHAAKGRLGETLEERIPESFDTIVFLDLAFDEKATALTFLFYKEPEDLERFRMEKPGYYFSN